MWSTRAAATTLPWARSMAHSGKRRRNPRLARSHRAVYPWPPRKVGARLDRGSPTRGVPWRGQGIISGQEAVALHGCGARVGMALYVMTASRSSGEVGNVSTAPPPKVTGMRTRRVCPLRVFVSVEASVHLTLEST